jgi:hypothetical protein
VPGRILAQSPRSLAISPPPNYRAACARHVQSLDLSITIRLARRAGNLQWALALLLLRLR